MSIDGTQAHEKVTQERPGFFKFRIQDFPFSLTRSDCSNIASLFAAREWLAIRKEWVSIGLFLHLELK